MRTAAVARATPRPTPRPDPATRAGDYVVLAETLPIAEVFPSVPCRFPVYATSPVCRTRDLAGVTLAAGEHRVGIDFLGTDVVFWDSIGGEE
jgi:hypothetical protein